MSPLIYLASVLLPGSLLVLAWALLSEGDERVAVNESVHENLARGDSVNAREIALAAPARNRLLDPVFGWIATRARSFTGGAGVRGAQRKLDVAGLRDTGWTVERLLAVQGLAMAIAIGVAVLVLQGGVNRNSLLLALVAVVIGRLAPNAYVDRKIGERQALIERQLPDVIDQLTVSVEAGLGFDGAFARTAEGRSGPLAEEFGRVLQDMQMGVPRDEALDRLVERTEVDDLRQFVIALRQASKHGLPVATVLRVQSEELRDKRKGRIEQKAGSLPVKIVFPLVFCILPSLFLVILGPAVLDMRDSF